MPAKMIISLTVQQLTAAVFLFSRLIAAAFYAEPVSG